MDSFILYFLKGLLSLCLSALGINFLWKNVFSSKSKNPFLLTKIFPPRPLETDRKVRKKVLKRSFHPDLVPKNLDAVIVGSGIGGLACAGLMARSGKRVLVLEQHDRAGGCTHSYKSKGFEFDVGIHYIGNIEKGSMNRCLIDLLTDNQLHWEEIDENFDTVVFNRPGHPSKDFAYEKGIKQAEEQLLAAFPQEHNGIKKYFKLLKKCKSTTTFFMILKMLPKFLLKCFLFLKLDKMLFADYHYLTQKSLKEVVDELTDNEELKALLTYCFGDYGVVPEESCLFMHAMLFNHLYRTGGFYPVGGASEIAYQMIPGIERSGGVVLTQAFVKEILIENDTACGVRLTASNSLEHTVRAPIIISGAGVYNTFNCMFPSNISKKYGVMNNIQPTKPGVTCLQIMVGLNGTKEELDISGKNYWMLTSYDPGKEFLEYEALSRADAIEKDIPVLFVSFPSAKDPTWSKRFPNKSTCIIVALSSMAWFEEWKNDKTKKRGAVYDSLKNTFVNQAWKQVLKKFPHLEDKVDHIEGGSPLSHIHYLNSQHGEIYGMHHCKERFFIKQAINLRPETSISNLYLTGQDVFTCGFIGGAFGGLLTASKVLDRYLILDLINDVSKTRKIIKAEKKLE